MKELAPDVGAYKVVPKRVCKCCDKGLGAAVDGTASIVVSRCNGGNVNNVPLHIALTSQHAHVLWKTRSWQARSRAADLAGLARCVSVAAVGEWP